MRRREWQWAVALVVFMAATLCTAQTTEKTTAKESEAEFLNRTAWWREAKFGMFIHWGLYAVPADSTDLQAKKGAGEWYMFNKQVQVKDYEKLAGQFNPVKFDARTWIKTAKQTGMKYLIITTKHHDGFCLYDTRLTDYCVTKATPWKHNPMKDLAAECRSQGIKLCFYYSIMDWHHPDYLPRRPWDKRPEDGANLDRYLDEYMKGQLSELLRNYGPIGILWWDGAWEHTAQELHSHDVNSFVRSLQPAILINPLNKLPEDYMMVERAIPTNGFPGGRPWETDMTINDTWGYAKNDMNWKSAKTLARQLIDVVSKGGNYVLNVGPTADGLFPEAINERLAQIGAWMRINGESIYGTTGSPFRKLSFDGRCTAKGDTLYLEVFNWPPGGLVIRDLLTPVRSARALEGGEELATEVEEQDGFKVLHIRKPPRFDPIATVVKLELAGPPRVAESNLALEAGPLPAPQEFYEAPKIGLTESKLAAEAKTKGTYVLPAVYAEIHGRAAMYDFWWPEQDYIGYWTDPGDSVSWLINVARTGRYRVEISYACLAVNAGSRFRVDLGKGAEVSGTVKATQPGKDFVAAGTSTDFRTDTLGELTLSPGLQTLSVRITALAHGNAMNLHEVRLTPVH